MNTNIDGILPLGGRFCHEISLGGFKIRLSPCHFIYLLSMGMALSPSLLQVESPTPTCCAPDHVTYSYNVPGGISRYSLRREPKPNQTKPDWAGGISERHVLVFATLRYVCVLSPG